MNHVTQCDVCGAPLPGPPDYDQICSRCLETLLADPESDEPEPLYAIALAYDSKDLCETRGQLGLMETMPQLPPGVYMIREAGALVADATRHADGSWVVEFYSGMRLSPGCIIV